MKAAAFLITALINGGIGALAFFMLLLSLNGFTSKQAEPGLFLFIVWALLAALIAGVLSFFAASYLIEKKSFNVWLAALLAVLIFVIAGAVADVVGFFVAVFLTSAMR